MRNVFKLPEREGDLPKGLVRSVDRIGQFIITRLVLKRWLDEDIGSSIQSAAISEDDLRRVPVATEDVKLRMRWIPAGAAKVGLAYTALEMSEGPYSSIAPVGLDYDKLKEEYNAVLCNPCRYHVASLYLTGSPALPLTSATEEIQALASLYIHHAAPGSTPARNSSLLRYVEAKAVLPYEDLKMARVKSTLTRATIS
ncbi:uncharacterized protein LOC144703225 [Wolffia australiana]